MQKLHFGLPALDSFSFLCVLCALRDLWVELFPGFVLNLEPYKRDMNTVSMRRIRLLSLTETTMTRILDFRPSKTSCSRPRKRT